MDNDTSFYIRLNTSGIIREINGFHFRFAIVNFDGFAQCSVLLFDNDSLLLSSPDYVTALSNAVGAANILSLLQYIYRNTDKYTELLAHYEDNELTEISRRCLSLLTQTWWDINEFGHNFDSRIHEFMQSIDQEILRRVPPPPIIPRVRDRSGYVYLLKASKSLYKIGYTNDPEDRLRTFDVKLPFRVQYACLIKSDDMRKLEKVLHERFKDKRIDGEFFRLSVADVAYIKALADGVSEEDLENGRYLVGSENLPLFDT